MNEQIQLIDSDNNVFPLVYPGYRFIISEEGSGIPEIEYVTQRGPFQHGESVVDYFLRPRIIQLVIRHIFKCRDDYWKGRQNLLNAVRPNKGTLVLRTIFRNGVRRDIDVLIQQGPGFSPRSRSWDDWALNETLRFIAHNPIYYDPTVRAITFGYTVDIQTFPVTFPIHFTEFQSGGAGVLDYQGNWIEYPTVIVNGPFSGFLVTNNKTSESIGITHNIEAGGSVIIDLDYSRKRVYTNTGENIIGSVSNTSDLATFHLDFGVNDISFVIFGGGSGTTASVLWKDRYIGLGLES
jgi:hypothetical protein